MTTIRFKPSPAFHATDVRDPQTSRVYCVAETPAALRIKLKGTRQVLSLPWGVAYVKAAELEAAATRARKTHSVRRSALIGGLR